MDIPSSPKMPRPIVISLGLILSVVCILTGVLVALHERTDERILANQQSGLSQAIDALLPPDSYDNEVLADRFFVAAPDLLGSNRPVPIYRARRDGKPIAALIRPIAPDGYRGAIELLVAIAYDGTLLGVQVLNHDETPGLGDAFETRDADWLANFKGLSLGHPPQQRWTVRKDGGDFDAFTGATITPRAIVKAVRKSLEFYRTSRDRIFEAPSES
jgi:Na+-translocating ferredoxin:NAD+ oxidoreductase subunit G